MAETNVVNEAEYKNYRLCVKKRLNIPFHKQRADMQRMSKSGMDVQIAMAGLPTTAERIEQLKEEYQVDENIDNPIIETYERTNRFKFSSSGS